MKTLILFLGVILTSLSAWAVEGVAVPTPLTKDLGEFYVSIGVMPIKDLKKDFPRAYKLLVKHHGNPSDKDTHHIAVSVWRSKDGKTEYISSLEVSAEVRSPIFRAQRKKLDKYPHQYGDNFGGWFDMSDKGLYHIAIIIKSGDGTKKVTFDYLMQ